SRCTSLVNCVGRAASGCGLRDYGRQPTDVQCSPRLYGGVSYRPVVRGVWRRRRSRLRSTARRLTAPEPWSVLGQPRKSWTSHSIGSCAPKTCGETSRRTAACRRLKRTKPGRASPRLRRWRTIPTGNHFTLVTTPRNRSARGEVWLAQVDKP